MTKPKLAELRVALTREDDGRWIGDVSEIPGALAYGADAGEAWCGAVALAMRIIADRLEQREPIPDCVAELFPGELDKRLLFKTDLDG